MEEAIVQDRVRPSESVQINIDIPPRTEPVPIPETKKDLQCVLEVISAKFHCIIVSQKGSFLVQTTTGQMSGEIRQKMTITHEYFNIGFRLNFSEIPQTSYIPLQSMSIDTKSTKGETRFKFHNVLVHFDQGSSILSVLKNRGSCSFTYKNELGSVVSLFSCEKFLKPNQGIALIRYFGLPESILRGHSRNRHGVRTIDVTSDLDEKRLVVSEESKLMFNSIVEKEGNVDLRWNGLKENIKIVRHKSSKDKEMFYLEERPRRKYPFGHFEISGAGSGKKNLVRFLYTAGEKVEGKLRPFVCPISGHLGFAMRFGTSTRRFKTFSKFIKTLTKWTQPCHGTAKFKMFMGNSPEISFAFNYDPLDPAKGKITISHWDIKGTLMNTYVCSIAHISGVFAAKSDMSPESNIQNHKEWVERYHCPHQDNCPRNCVGYLPNQADGRETRVAIPKAIHCNCVGEDGYIPVCSKYHYYIELCREIPIQMGGFFTTMIHDYRKNPKMYTEAPIQTLLDGSPDIMYYIETFLYGVKL